MHFSRLNFALCVLLAGAFLGGNAFAQTAGRLQVRWRYDAGKALHATPAAGGGKLFLADASGRVVALDLAKREKVWETAGKGDVSAGLRLDGKRLIVADEEGVVRALSTEDGKELWRFAAKDKILGRPALAEGILYVGSYDYHLYALESASGRLLWQFKTGAQVHAAPTVAEGRVLIAGCDGNIRAIDARSGQEKWKLDAGDPMATSPQVKDGMALVGTLKGACLAVEVASGKLRWRSDGRETGQESIMSAASFAQDQVSFMTQEGTQVSYGVQDGKWRASSRYAGRFSSDGVQWGGGTWYAAEEGKVYGPVAKGRAAVSFTAGGEIKASPLVVGEELIVVDESGMVWGLSREAATVQ